ncbi:MAG: hypothetical protein WBM61_15780, partial [Woeseiaceae bacterium]
SQKRPAAFAAKSMKDLSQAAQIFEVLLDSRPGDITLAFDAARTQGEAFVSDFMAGLRLIDKEVTGAVFDRIDNNTF